MALVLACLLAYLSYCLSLYCPLSYIDTSVTYVSYPFNIPGPTQDGYSQSGKISSYGLQSEFVCKHNSAIYMNSGLTWSGSISQLSMISTSPITTNIIVGYSNDIVIIVFDSTTMSRGGDIYLSVSPVNLIFGSVLLPDNTYIIFYSNPTASRFMVRVSGTSKLTLPVAFPLNGFNFTFFSLQNLCIGAIYTLPGIATLQYSVINLSGSIVDGPYNLTTLSAQYRAAQLSNSSLIILSCQDGIYLEVFEPSMTVSYTMINEASNEFTWAAVAACNSSNSVMVSYTANSSAFIKIYAMDLETINLPETMINDDEYPLAAYSDIICLRNMNFGFFSMTRDVWNSIFIQISTNGSCNGCGEGYFYNEAVLQCQLCPIYTAVGKDNCIACGYYLYNGECHACLQGYYTSLAGCVSCIESGCNSTLPHCNTTNGFCESCLYDSECSNNLTCSSQRNCVECVSYLNCTANFTRPSCIKNTCSACYNDTDCPPGLYCQLGSCYHCLNNSQCPLTNQSICDIENKTCRGCKTDADCSGLFCNMQSLICENNELFKCENDYTVCPAGLYCQLGSCYDCLNNSQCPLKNQSICDYGNKTCRGCETDAECMQLFECENSDTNCMLGLYCQLGSCYNCLNNSQCPLKNQSICDSVNKICRGCETDGDCGGLFCNTKSLACETCQLFACEKCLHYDQCAICTSKFTLINNTCIADEDIPTFTITQSKDFPFKFFIQFDHDMNFSLAQLQSQLEVNFQSNQNISINFLVIRLSQSLYELDFNLNSTTAPQNIDFIFTEPTLIIADTGISIQRDIYTLSADSIVSQSLVASVQKLKGIFTSSGVISSGLVIIMSNPSFIWLMINLAQNYYYFVFFNIALPYNINTLLGLFNIAFLSFLPNPLASLPIHLSSYDLPSPSKFSNQNIGSLFLIYGGNLICLLIGGFVLFMASKLVLKYTRMFGALFRNLLTNYEKNYKWSLAIQLYTTVYMLVTIAAALQMQNFKSDNIVQIISSNLAILIYCFNLFAPFFIIKFTSKHKRKISGSL